MSTAERKARLEALRKELGERQARLQNHQHRADGALEPDFAEQANQRSNDEVVDQLERDVGAELTQIGHALQRIAEGRGEECESCGEPIAPQRLQALPQATRCVNCA